MKRLAIILFLFLLFVPSSFAQSFVEEWEAIYDTPGLDAGEEGRSVCFGDGIAIVAIISFSPEECALAHYNMNGTKEMEKKISLGIWDENERNAAVCFFNETVVVAYTYRNIHMMAYNRDGSVLWKKQWGKEATVHDIAVDAQGNIYVLGFSHEEEALCILKYTQNGDASWNISLGGKGMGIDVTDAIFVVGYEENHTILLKIDFFGNVIWKKIYTIAKGCDVSGGDEITIVGENNGSIVAFRCDKNGNVIWLTDYEEKSIAHGVDVDEKGNTFIAGSGYNQSSKDYDFLMLEYSHDGHFIRKIGYNGDGSRDDEAWDVAANKEIVVTGFITRKKVVSPPQGIALDIDAYTVKYSMENIPPHANFSWEPEKPTTEKEVRFFDESIDIDGQITKWQWDFGDEKTSYQQNPTYVYEKEGTYHVNLTVTDDEGAQHWIIKEITIHGKKTPGFEIAFLLCALIFIFVRRRWR